MPGMTSAAAPAVRPACRRARSAGGARDTQQHPGRDPQADACPPAVTQPAAARSAAPASKKDHGTEGLQHHDPDRPAGAVRRAALVDYGPAREHVQMLGRFGIGWKRVAALVGRPEPTVYKLLYGTRTRPPKQKIRPGTEAAILAVQPAAGNLAGGARVDGTGSRRRLQALDRQS